MKWKKTLASVLAIVLMLGLLPGTAFAAEKLQSNTGTIDSGTTYEVTNDVTTTSNLIVKGTLTINKKLTIGSGFTLRITTTGSVIVENGGSLDFDGTGTLSVMGSGSLLFNEGASSNKEIDSKYIADGCEVDHSTERYEVKKSSDLNKDKDATDEILWEKIEEFYTAFAGYEDTLVFSTAEEALFALDGQLEGKKVSDIDEIITEAEEHIPVMQALDEAKADAISDLEAYYRGQTKYTDGLNETLEAGKTSINAVPYVAESYLAEIDENCLSEVDTKLEAAEKSIDARVLENAKAAIAEQIRELKDTYPNAANIETKAGSVAGADVPAVEKYLDDATRDIAANDVRTYADNNKTEEDSTLNDAIDKEVESYGKNTAKVPTANLPYFVSLTEGNIDDLVEADGILTQAKNAAKNRIENYIDTNKNKWESRVTGAEHGFEELKEKVKAQDYTSGIETATTVDAVTDAETAAQDAIDLAVEKVIAKWELEKAVKDAKGTYGEVDLTAILNEYEDSIDEETSVAGVKRQVNAGKKEIEAEATKQKAESDLTNARTEAESKLDGYLEEYLGSQESGYTAEGAEGKEKLDEAVITNLKSKTPLLAGTRHRSKEPILRTWSLCT